MPILVTMCKGRGPSLQSHSRLAYMHGRPSMQRGLPHVEMQKAQQLVFKHCSLSDCSKNDHPWSRSHSKSVHGLVRFHCSSSGDEAVIQRTQSRDKPMDWEELQDLIVIRKDLALLYRCQQVEDRYTQHRLELSQTYDSICDYILHTKFHMPRQWNPQTSRWHVPYDTNSTSTLTALVPNDFPYCTTPDVQHWVLWKLGQQISDEDMAHAIQTLCDDHKARATIHWENPPHLKSLPTINHYHILIKT